MSLVWWLLTRGAFVVVLFLWAIIISILLMGIIEHMEIIQIHVPYFEK